MKLISKLIVGTLLSMGMSMAFAVPAADISGSYKCTGYDPIGKNGYEMNVTVIKTGDTYKFRWGSTEEGFSGTGLYSKMGEMAVEFWNPRNDSRSGVIVYQVKADGILDGVFTYADQTTTGTEICNKK